jgi:Cys/Met metabolism PLP-dependent enzyme
MTPDDQPTAPARLHPETVVICAGRPGRTAGEPLSHPIVLASNFHAGTTAAPGTGQDSRACSRTDATPLLQQPLALGADVVVHSATPASRATPDTAPPPPR